MKLVSNSLDVVARHAGADVRLWRVSHNNFIKNSRSLPPHRGRLLPERTGREEGEPLAIWSGLGREQRVIRWLVSMTTIRRVQSARVCLCHRLTVAEWCSGSNPLTVLLSNNLELVLARMLFSGAEVQKVRRRDWVLLLRGVVGSDEN